MKHDKLSKVTELVSRSIRIPFQADSKAVDLMFILPRSTSSSPASVLLTLVPSPWFYKIFLSFVLYLWWPLLWFFSSSTSSSFEVNYTFFLEWLHPVSTTKQTQPGSSPPWVEAVCLKPNCSLSSRITLLGNEAQISGPLSTPALLSTFHHWIPWKMEKSQQYGHPTCCLAAHLSKDIEIVSSF